VSHLPPKHARDVMVNKDIGNDINPSLARDYLLKNEEFQMAKEP